MKTISASVGLRGMNRVDDVRAVQHLLNQIPEPEGGPSPKLAEDGLCGMLTNGAIEKLQAKKWGWKRVDTRVDPDGPTWQVLLTYDESSVEPPAPPPEPKVLGSKFLLMLAAKPNAQLSAENFYFQILDYVNQKQRALYYFGYANPPKPSYDSGNWSITNPGIVMTPEPIGVADWVGDAIFTESTANNTIETIMYVMPEALNKRMVRFGLHAHKDKPYAGQGAIRSTISAPFRLIEVAPGVQL